MRFFCVFVATFGLSVGLYHYDEHIWSYDERKGDGPSVWDILSPTCGPSPVNSPIRIPSKVNREDPIDIAMEGTRHSEVYQRNMDHTVVTTLGSRTGMGNSDGNFKIRFSKDIPSVGIKKNELFCLDRIEWRWGVDNKHGSEHWIGEAPFPLELQLHMFNCSFTDYTAAVRASLAHDENAQPKAHLLSMAVLFEADQGTISAEPLRLLISKMGLIRDPKNAFQPLRLIEYKEDNKFDVADVLPSQRDFYAYNGRMTRPPCAKAAWVVFQQPVKIGLINANEIRLGIFDFFMNAVKHNARPLQRSEANATNLKLFAPVAI